MPDLVIVGGPNGAGKTSWARKYLPNALGIDEFINADDIAREIWPDNPDAAAFSAGRLSIERSETALAAGKDFGVETTCAGHSHVRLIAQSRARAYRITLVFLWLPSVELALHRVRQRVSQGGHSIPEPVVRRRYRAGLRNMRRLYLPLIDIGLIYDNSDNAPHLIAEQRLGSPVLVHDRASWLKIEEVSQWPI